VRGGAPVGGVRRRGRRFIRGRYALRTCALANRERSGAQSSAGMQATVGWDRTWVSAACASAKERSESRSPVTRREEEPRLRWERGGAGVSLGCSGVGAGGGCQPWRWGGAAETSANERESRLPLTRRDEEPRLRWCVRVV
jgi:hypothetical protein